MLENFWIFFRKFLENFWEIFDKFLKKIGIFLENFGKFSENYCKIFGKLTKTFGKFSEIFEKISENYWKIFGNNTGNFCSIFEKLMKILIFSLIFFRIFFVFCIFIQSVTRPNFDEFSRGLQQTCWGCTTDVPFGHSLLSARAFLIFFKILENFLENFWNIFRKFSENL